MLYVHPLDSTKSPRNALCVVFFCGDHIDHLAVCEHLSNCSRTFWGQPISLDRVAIASIGFSQPGTPVLSNDEIAKIWLHLYASLKVYNSARVGCLANTAFYHCALVELAGKCRHARLVINSLRRCDLSLVGP